ncbi:MAG: glycosyltransferase family 4 protein [Pelolinea sp.]|nr:glycosyltransferase family 4 protein [Pelolinea sp.]
MRILLVADGRSPITKNWIRMLGDVDLQISLISTYPAEPIPGVEHQFTLPVGFSSFAGGQVKRAGQTKPTLKNRIVAILRPILMRIRALITPLLLARSQKQFLQIVEQISPDIVHALRIPFEGMLAAALQKRIPLIISIWGNDLSLHAHTSFSMAARIRETLRRADGLMADAASDIQLASEWGLRSATPGIVVPGSGGLDLDALRKPPNQSILKKYGLPKNRQLVINPRGFRPGSVHQDVFFKSVPLILEQNPNVHFVCTGMAGQPQAEKWVRDYGIKGSVTLLPYLPQEELWALYALADVYISLSSHDGTPNSFLEAIACGCFPVVGDIPSLQEWIDQGKNGSMVDPQDARTAADAVIRALRDEALRNSAESINQDLVSERANIQLVKKQVREFYQQFI